MRRRSLKCAWFFFFFLYIHIYNFFLCVYLIFFCATSLSFIWHGWLMDPLMMSGNRVSHHNGIKRPAPLQAIKYIIFYNRFVLLNVFLILSNNVWLYMSPPDNNISYVPFPCQDESAAAAAAELPKTELCGQVIITIVISSSKNSDPSRHQTATKSIIIFFWH